MTTADLSEIREILGQVRALTHKVESLVERLDADRRSDPPASVSEPHLPPPLRDCLAVRVGTAAAVLECGRSTIYDRIEAGDLRVKSVGSSQARRIPVEDLLALLRDE